jgi:hypothetical protein
MHMKVARLAAAAAAVLCAFPLVSAATAAASGAGHPLPVAPWRPGDKVWTSSPPPQSELAIVPLTSGCERVPATGYIGSGVYSQTAAHASSFWDWTGSSSNQPFHWYIFSAGGSILIDAHSWGVGGSTGVSAGNRFWKVENLGTTPQAWNVCWS